jgi:cellulase/cellobiase CelA1
MTAQVTVTAAWNGGYVAAVRITNTGGKAASWTVRITHSGLAGVRLGGTWNGAGTQQGDTFVFTGGQLAAGATTTFGYQMTKNNDRDRGRPSGCTVVGGRCSVS